MAEGLTTVVGDALLALVDIAWPDVRPRVEHFVEQVADAVRPDPPLVLTTPDGGSVTGLVVLDRGNAVLFFGTRQPRNPISMPASNPRGYDEEQPLWGPRPYAR